MPWYSLCLTVPAQADTTPGHVASDRILLPKGIIRGWYVNGAWAVARPLLCRMYLDEIIAFPQDTDPPGCMQRQGVTDVYLPEFYPVLKSGTLFWGEAWNEGATELMMNLACFLIPQHVIEEHYAVGFDIPPRFRKDE